MSSRETASCGRLQGPMSWTGLFGEVDRQSGCRKVRTASDVKTTHKTNDDGDDYII